MENIKTAPSSETPNVIYLQSVEPSRPKKGCRPFLHVALGFLFAAVLFILLLFFLKWGPFHSKRELNCYSCGHIFGTEYNGEWNDFFHESCATRNPLTKFKQSCSKDNEACGKFEVRRKAIIDDEEVYTNLLTLKGCIPKLKSLDGTCKSINAEDVIGNDTEYISQDIRLALEKVKGETTSEICSCSTHLCNASTTLYVERLTCWMLVLFLYIQFKHLNLW